MGIDELRITFNQPETLTAAEVSVSSLIKGRKYGPVTIASSGSAYDILLARPINKADRVTITIAGAGIASYARRLDVLPGDFDGNGVVNKRDITGIRNEWKGKKEAVPTIYGEILGDGTVNASDYNAARKRVGTRLPKLPKTRGRPSTAILVRARWNHRSQPD